MLSLALKLANLFNADWLESLAKFLAVLICASTIPLTSLIFGGASHVDVVVTLKGQLKVY